jgi:hypothetical protein
MSFRKPFTSPPSREAIVLASFSATLLAPVLTGTLIAIQGGPDELINGMSALVGAVAEMPGTLALIWLVFYVSGRLVRGARWPSVLFLIVTALVVGGCVALFRFELTSRLNTSQGQAALGIFLLAGAITGAGYAWLLWFWDRLLMKLSK